MAATAEVYNIQLESGDDYYNRFRGQGASINVYNRGEYIADGSYDILPVNRAFAP